MTYQELYLAALENVLVGGGQQDVIDKAIDEFNAPTAEGLAAWAKTVTYVACSTCGMPFKPESARLSEEVLCTEHATKTTT